MDRNTEMIEEKFSRRPTTNLATLIKTPSTPTTTTTTTIIEKTAADGDSSMESSDTFESWTLVNNKENNKQRDNLKNMESHVEILNSSDHYTDEHESDENKIKQETQLRNSINDVSNDDFSDGISIISECESVGRISPHPYLREHLHDLNLKFSLSDHMDDTILNELREDLDNEVNTPLSLQQSQEPIAAQELRQRHRSLTDNARETKALQKSSQTMAVYSAFPPYIKHGFRGIFYLGVCLAILGLIGKIIHPSWQPLASVGSSFRLTEELEQKLNDMELQNNLMRAEIDLLNKQVKYLSIANDPQHHKQGKYKDLKDSKTFKAWSGNGDSLKPVDITKQELRNPYKCPDGSFVEIANMCMEQRPAHYPSIVDQFGHIVQDFKEQSDTFKAFAKVADELQGFQENPFEQIHEVFNDPVTTKTPSKQYVKNKSIYNASEDKKRDVPFTDKYNKQPPMEEESYSAKPHKHHINDENAKQNKEYKKSFEINKSKEFKKYQNYHANIRGNPKETNEWKTSQFNDNSKERIYRNNKEFDGSKENTRDKQSKQRYNRQKLKYDSANHVVGDHSGEWQENYMKHREQQRKQNEQKYPDNKNWYFKRGDSRENKRGGEKRFR